MAEGYARSTGKVGVCVATSGPGRHQLRHLPGRRQDGLGAPRRHHRPGRHAGHRHRRLPGNAHHRGLPGHHQAPLPGDAHRGHDRASSRRRSTSPAPAGPARSSSTCPRTCRTRSIVPDYDPPMNLPGYRPDRRASRERAGSGPRGDPPEPQADHLRRRRHHRVRGGARTCGPSPSEPASPWP